MTAVDRRDLDVTKSAQPLRLAWIGESDASPFAELRAALDGDGRVASVTTISRTVGPAESFAGDFDAAILAVHHFEPSTSAWFDGLTRHFEAVRWRSALGPFAAVAGRAAFDVLHRQSFLAANGRAALDPWLESLGRPQARGVGNDAEPRSVGPLKILVWKAGGEGRDGIDEATLACFGDVRRIAPRDVGLPFLPDVTVAWVAVDASATDRVHLRQLRQAAPHAAWVTAFASPAAKRRLQVRADAELIWPFDVRELRAAVGIALPAQTRV